MRDPSIKPRNTIIIGTPFSGVEHVALLLNKRTTHSISGEFPCEYYDLVPKIININYSRYAYTEDSKDIRKAFADQGHRERCCSILFDNLIFAHQKFHLTTTLGFNHDMTNFIECMRSMYSHETFFSSVHNLRVIWMIDNEHVILERAQRNGVLEAIRKPDLYVSAVKNQIRQIRSNIELHDTLIKYESFNEDKAAGMMNIIGVDTRSSVDFMIDKAHKENLLTY